MHSVRIPASKTNALVALFLSNDSQVKVSDESDVALIGVGWFASYSVSKSSTWNARKFTARISERSVCRKYFVMPDAMATLGSDVRNGVRNFLEKI